VFDDVKSIDDYRSSVYRCSLRKSYISVVIIESIITNYLLSAAGIKHVLIIKYNADIQFNTIISFSYIIVGYNVI